VIAVGTFDAVEKIFRWFPEITNTAMGKPNR
jgi:hypothetical protein